MQKKGKINLDEVIGDFVVKNTSAFKSYLKQLWNDLSKREKSIKNGIDRISFGKYYDLPGLISERLFSVFDLKNKGYLTVNDFTSSMIKLFSGDYEQLLHFIFEFYDFDKDNKITKEDIRIVLSYVPLYKKIKHYQGLKFEKDNFEDRLASQKELHEKLDNLFKLKQIINFEEFKYIVQNINSDIFLYILVFLMERRPFSNETIKNLENIKKNSDTDERKSKKIFHKKQFLNKNYDDNFIVLPNVNSKLIVSRTITSKSPSIKKRFIEKINSNEYYKKTKDTYIKKQEYKDLLAMNSNESGNESIHTNGTIQKKPSRKTLKNISLMDIEQENENDIKYKNEDEGILDYARPYELYNNKNMEDELNSTQMTNISKINNNILTEGYLFKIQENKVKKIYFKLICKDLYYYKSKTNKRHKGIHNLSGVFIQSNGLVKLGDKQFYCFTIIFPTKPRKYYLTNESEYYNWVNTIRKIVGYSNLSEIYEIRQVLGKGKFGLVKLGIHRGSGRKVAIKIINKKLVTAIDVQQVKTEIDILKIAKHPNIIQLYDVFENENYIYIIMEYCAGGDLFSYIEKRGFRLPETRAAEIIHKLKIIGPGEMCTDPFGTFSYVAPEVLKEKPYSFKVDLFAIGIIAYLLVAGFLPFDHETSEKEIARQTVYEPTPFPISIWKNISNEARMFVDNLLQKNPEKRMDIKEVLQHKWLQKFNAKESISFKKRNESDLSGAQKFEAFSTLSKE